MKMISKWFTRGVSFVTATMLAAMFVTFLLQIFSRYVLQTPFGWTLELCLILWVWIVFFGCAFLVRKRTTLHSIFSISPRRADCARSWRSSRPAPLSLEWAGRCCRPGTTSTG